jgi:hypothetical protein
MTEVNPIYVGHANNTCPTCRNEKNTKPVPLYIAMVVLGVVVLIMLYILLQYYLAKKEVEMCKAFKTGRHDGTNRG